MSYRKQEFRSGDKLTAAALNAMDNQILENSKVADWAKQSEKPTYTAEEVGALSLNDLENYYNKEEINDLLEENRIDTDNSEIVNEVISNLITDSEFITKSSTDLENYYTKDKVDELKTYLTPEMFGAVPDTEGDSTEAIQKCLDEAVNAQLNVKFGNNYRISDTLVFQKTDSTNRYPMSIDGGHYRIRTTANKPLLKIRGEYMNVENLTLTYANAFDDPNTDGTPNYTSSMVILEADSNNPAKLIDGLQLNNIRCLSSGWPIPAYKQSNVGFHIICNGNPEEQDDLYKKSHVYNVNFKSCMAEQLGTALKIDMNEHNQGVNGNIFDLTSWACAKYVDGPCQGSYFSGVVQASEIARDENGVAINPYLITNIGTDNIFDVKFYDVKWDSESPYQQIMDVNNTGNIFSFSTTQAAFNSSPLYFGGITSYEIGKVTLPYNPSYGTVGTKDAYNVLRTMPLQNSFADPSIKITATHEGLEDFSGTWGKLHTEFDNTLVDGKPIHMSKNLDVLFRDNSWGRKTAVFYSKPNATLDFLIQFPENETARIDALFVDFGNVSEDPQGKIELELNYTNSRGELKVKKGTVTTVARHRMGFVSGTQDANTFILKIKFNVDGVGKSKDFISQITGYAHNDNGLIGVPPSVTDVSKLENNLENTISELETNLENSIVELETNLNNSIAEVETNLRNSISEVENNQTEPVIENYKKISGYQDVINEAVKFEGKQFCDRYTGELKEENQSGWNYYKLSVKGGEMYNIHCPCASWIAAIYMLDENGTIVLRYPEEQPTTTFVDDYSVTVPDNVTSIIFHEIPGMAEQWNQPKWYASIQRNTGLGYVEIERPWDHLYKKKLVCVGDSITEAKKPSNEGGFYKNYAEIVAERHNMTVYKDGVSGSTMGKIDYATHTDPSKVPGEDVIPFCDESRYKNIPDDFDILTIWFGWNDHSYGKLGTPEGAGEDDDTTFYGAYSKVLEYYLTTYPTKKIGLIVPYGKIPEIQEAVRYLSTKYGIPCLDLADGNVCSAPWWYIHETPTEWQKARTDALTHDSTHPNQAGHEFLATMYETFIARL